MLNPAPLDGSNNANFESTFIFEDPYGVNPLDDDKNSETEDDEPTLTCGSQVETLDKKCC